MRGEVHVSPSGSLDAVNACGPASCLTQVAALDDDDATRQASIGGGFLRALTDDKVILTDSSGTRYTYSVYKSLVVDPDALYVTKPVPARVSSPCRHAPCPTTVSVS